MIGRIIDDMKESAGMAVKLTSLAAAIAFALLITFCFLCAAAFVYVLQNYGPVEACLAGAAIFLLVAAIGTAIYVSWKKQPRRHSSETSRSALQSALKDPALIATGIQLVRAIGVKKLLPILAVGGLALGLLANRAHSNQAPDQAPAE